MYAVSSPFIKTCHDDSSCLLERLPVRGNEHDVAESCRKALLHILEFLFSSRCDRDLTGKGDVLFFECYVHRAQAVQNLLFYGDPVAAARAPTLHKFLQVLVLLATAARQRRLRCDYLWMLPHDLPQRL